MLKRVLLLPPGGEGALVVHAPQHDCFLLDDGSDAEVNEENYYL